MIAYVTMPLRISAEMAERIDAYWHEHRIKNRAEAIRELLERGLKRDQPDEPAT
jgi:metal-responsive CopG/Arc/MetJ family transcriptional regulator